jgi:hypothetical protein
VPVQFFTFLHNSPFAITYREFVDHPPSILIELSSLGEKHSDIHHQFLTHCFFTELHLDLLELPHCPRRKSVLVANKQPPPCHTPLPISVFDVAVRTRFVCDCSLNPNRRSSKILFEKVPPPPTPPTQPLLGFLILFYTLPILDPIIF